MNQIAIGRAISSGVRQAVFLLAGDGSLSHSLSIYFGGQSPPNESLEYGKQ